MQNTGYRAPVNVSPIMTFSLTELVLVFVRNVSFIIIISNMLLMNKY